MRSDLWEIRRRNGWRRLGVEAEYDEDLGEHVHYPYGLMSGDPVSLAGGRIVVSGIGIDCVTVEVSGREPRRLTWHDLRAAATQSDLRLSRIYRLILGVARRMASEAGLMGYRVSVWVRGDEYLSDIDQRYVMIRGADGERHPVTFAQACGPGAKQIRRIPVDPDETAEGLAEEAARDATNREIDAMGRANS